MPASLTAFPFLSSLAFFLQTFIQYYKTQFRDRKGQTLQGKTIGLELVGKLRLYSHALLNILTRMGSRCAQVPRAADGGTREGSDD